MRQKIKNFVKIFALLTSRLDDFSGSYAKPQSGLVDIGLIRKMAYGEKKDLPQSGLVDTYRTYS